ncbi:hypothetical protein DFP72DRAFT_1109552 [Ephemerocybe angulata]|uniref:Uncharacterized protein n=1 Tax=Ephemerocybe angulata TaxID=980116 RepID=A0A8H6I584_9AGAR|nr:hypothetical protein DFP72DRAFT_1109552 [Tulosesus angulatus]
MGGGLCGTVYIPQSACHACPARDKCPAGSCGCSLRVTAMSILLARSPDAPRMLEGKPRTQTRFGHHLSRWIASHVPSPPCQLNGVTVTPGHLGSRQYLTRLRQPEPITFSTHSRRRCGLLYSSTFRPIGLKPYVSFRLDDTLRRLVVIAALCLQDAIWPLDVWGLARTHRHAYPVSQNAKYRNSRLLAFVSPACSSMALGSSYDSPDVQKSNLSRNALQHSGYNSGRRCGHDECRSLSSYDSATIPGTLDPFPGTPKIPISRLLAIVVPGDNGPQICSRQRVALPHEVQPSQALDRHTHTRTPKETVGVSHQPKTQFLDPAFVLDVFRRSPLNFALCADFTRSGAAQRAASTPA